MDALPFSFVKLALHRPNAHLARVGLLTALIAGACSGDDQDPTSPDASVVGEDGGSGTSDLGPRDGGEEVPEDPLFLISGIAFTPDGTVVFGIPTSDAAAPGNIDLENAFVVSGFSLISAPSDPDGTFFVGLEEEPTIQKYTIDAQRRIRLDDEVSLAGLGLATVGGGNGVGVVIASPTKGYAFDSAEGLAVEFNPTTMALTADFPLPGLFPESETVDTSITAAFVDGDRVVVAARYFGPERPLREGRLAFIDLSDNSITYATQTDCGNHLWRVETDEAFDLAPHPNQASFHAVGLVEDAPCAKRLRRGATEFDPDYTLDLNAAVGGLAGGAVQGPDSIAYVPTYDEVLGGPITPENAGTQTTGKPAWRLTAVDLETGLSLGPVGGVPPGGGAALGFALRVDEATVLPFVSVVTSLAGTTVFDLSDPDNVREVYDAPGFVFGAYRVR